MAGLLRWTPWGLLLVFMAKVGSYEPARYLASLYPLLFPALLATAGHAQIVRHPLWRRSAGGVVILTMIVILFSRHRPLFPAGTITAWLSQQFPQSRLVAEMRTAYNYGLEFPDALRPLRNQIPPGEAVIGYALGERDGCFETSLWRPIGHRMVERVLNSDPLSSLRERGIHYVVVESSALRPVRGQVDEWLADHEADLVDSIFVQSNPSKPPLPVYLARLRPPNQTASHISKP